MPFPATSTSSDNCNRVFLGPNKALRHLLWRSPFPSLPTHFLQCGSYCLIQPNGMDCGQQAWGINTPVWKEPYCSNHPQASSHEPRSWVQKECSIFPDSKFYPKWVSTLLPPTCDDHMNCFLFNGITLFKSREKGIHFKSVSKRSIKNVYSLSTISIIKPWIKQHPERLCKCSIKDAIMLISLPLIYTDTGFPSNI